MILLPAREHAWLSPSDSDEFDRAFRPTADTIFSARDVREVWKTAQTAFVRADWISVVLECDILGYYHDPDAVEAPDMRRDQAQPECEPLGHTWAPFMETLVAEGGGRVVFCGDYFPSSYKPSWRERMFAPIDSALTRLLTGPDTGVVEYAIFNAACAPSWDEFAECRSSPYCIAKGTYVAFGEDARWGAVCYEDTITVLGGDQRWMNEFVRRSGGMAAIRDRFVRMDSQLWLSLTRLNKSDSRAFGLRLANWGAVST